MEERLQLRNIIAAHRDRFVIIYATGRNVDKVFCLDLPLADYLICDVGTSVRDGAGKHIAPVQEWIQDKWGKDSSSVCEAIMADIPNLRNQHAPEADKGCRQSYKYKNVPEATLSEAYKQFEALGLDPMIANGCYFDVLPKGVSKGPTLKKLLQHLDLPLSRLVVAGDSFNDYSLFELVEEGGLGAIMVANADAQLRDSVEGMKRVMRATKEGAGGILEGLVSLGVMEV